MDLCLHQNKSIDHSINDVTVNDDDNEAEALYKIYRKKLQHFLQNSSEYRPDRISKFLPPDFLHEQALLLSHLGHHEQVLDIYINRVKNVNLATSYCDRMYRQLQPCAKSTSSAIDDNSNTMNVYLCLFRVILASDSYISGDQLLDNDTITSVKDKNRARVIKLAESNFERFSPLDFLELLSDDVPVASIATYLFQIIEYKNTKKKNLQVLHQVLRMREVKLRTDDAY